jgi:[ribosomal protein S18]-alanine N-acetyltransferase
VPETAFHLRPARPADLPALAALEQATFDYDRMSPRQLRHHLGNPSAALLLAEDASGLLGSALLLFRRGSAQARLYSLATAAAARGRGIGRALLAAAEQAAAARGASRLRLEVRRDNTAAVQLYESRGYRRIAALAGYYDDGADGWRFEKSLHGIQP